MRSAILILISAVLLSPKPAFSCKSVQQAPEDWGSKQYAVYQANISSEQNANSVSLTSEVLNESQIAEAEYWRDAGAIVIFRVKDTGRENEHQFLGNLFDNKRKKPNKKLLDSNKFRKLDRSLDGKYAELYTKRIFKLTPIQTIRGANRKKTLKLWNSYIISACGLRV